MRFLFVHQNFPGQFPHLSAALARQGHEVVAIGETLRLRQRGLPHPNIERIGYETPKPAGEATHPYLRDYEAHIRRGQAVARVGVDLTAKGYRPDVVVAHPGWGEALFLKDVFPAARHLHYCEFFYRADGADIGFDPESPASLDERLRTRIRNSTQLVGLEFADGGMSPTAWQAGVYPSEMRSKIQVMHDGIDTSVVKPDPSARLQIGDLTLGAEDEIVTYVARNLEPYRGFHIFMRALPQLLEARPRARVVIVGGDEVSYGNRAPGGKPWREHCFDPIRSRLDASRVHFLGRVPYLQYLKVLQVSSVHAYLTYPFVLSWSMLEAMAAGCLVVGSDTAPVREVIEPERNGLLCDFFAVEAWARRLADVLARRDQFADMRRAARQTICEAYDLKTICLPQQLRYVLDGAAL